MRIHAKGEFGTLASLMLLALLAFAFARVASEMNEGETRSFDNAVMLALRGAGDDPVGPLWVEEAVRDITSLGSNVVLIGLALATVGFLWMSGARGAAWLVCASVGSGMLLIQFFKNTFERVRPELVAHSLSHVTWSFPSGHATMSAVTYLTLGALLARIQPHPALKAYLLIVAVLLTLLVGTSRVYLGVHWPTDVLAGWCLGSAWALAWWLVAVRLQRGGRVEKRINA